MTEESPNEPLFWQLFKLYAQAKHVLIRIAEAHGLTVVQMHALCLMEPGKAMPMSAISLTMSCDASNVTGVVDRLFAQGFITREEKPEDRRIKMVGLTVKGEAMRRTLLAELPQYELEGLRQLTKDEERALRQILKKLAAFAVKK